MSATLVLSFQAPAPVRRKAHERRLKWFGLSSAVERTNFCGLHANVFGEMHRVVQGIASELLDRIDRLGGLNAPHLILGKILAQAYDTAAYKTAADDLLLSHGVDILFHALGAGVVMHDARRINALMLETKAGRRAVRAGIFIDCSGDGDLAAWAGARHEVGDNAGSMLYPSMMFRLNGIDPEKTGAWRTIPALMEKAEAVGTHHFPRKAAIVRPQRSHVAGDVIFKFPPIPESRGFNELPYRMLVPEAIDNLLVAGRCASMNHDGQSAARVSGACFAMGEAAGFAAALALGGNTIPRDIAVDKLQLQLKQAGAFIGQDQAIPEGL